MGISGLPLKWGCINIMGSVFTITSLVRIIPEKESFILSFLIIETFSGAVIIMGFVIFVGMNAMEMMRIEQCRSQIEQKLENFKTALETTVTQRIVQSINFTLPSCFSSEQESINIEKHDDAKFCAAHCQFTKKTCILLQYWSTEFPIPKCLDISTGTTFLTTDYECPPLPGLTDDDPEHWQKVDLPFYIHPSPY